MSPLVDEPGEISAITNRRNLAADVVDRLRQAIWNGQFEPGMQLREEELAERLQVSRGPIREALAQLEREGLVIKPPNKSAIVARLSREDLEEVYSLRNALEQLAVQQAIKNAQPEHLTKMQNVVDEMAACLDRGINEQEAATLDIQFHELIYQAANHKRLYEFWSILRPQIHIFFLTRIVANPDFRDYMLSTHQEILKAISDKDEPQAVALIKEHIQHAYGRILDSYSQHEQDTLEDASEL